MRRFASTLALPVLIVVAIVVSSAVYIVDVRQKALVLRFGEVVAVREQPGLGVKVPLLDRVLKYDARILGLQTEPMEVTPLDDRRLVVDAFARWQITDVVRFRRAVGSGGVDLAQQRLQGIMTNAIRGVLGSVPSTAVLSVDRTSLMNQIRDVARVQAENLGVQVIDVRLTRTDLPEQNLAATYARMRAEREREAADEIARGGEAAQRVRASADRTVIELTSEARRRAEVIRGEADARRNAIYADAFGRDPEFFAFTRSMTAYERAMRGENSSIVMEPDGEFFTYLRSDGSERAVALRAAEAEREQPPASEGEPVASDGSDAASEAAPVGEEADPLPDSAADTAASTTTNGSEASAFGSTSGLAPAAADATTTVPLLEPSPAAN